MLWCLITQSKIKSLTIHFAADFGYATHLENGSEPERDMRLVDSLHLRVA